MKNIILLISMVVLYGCENNPKTPEEVMEEFLTSLARCDKENLLKITSGDAHDDVNDMYSQYDCNTNENEVIEITCDTTENFAECCCHEFNPKGFILYGESYNDIYTKYGLKKIDGEWTVDFMYKESDLGFDGIDICN